MHFSLRHLKMWRLYAPWELEADGLADPGGVGGDHPNAVRGGTVAAVG